MALDTCETQSYVHGKNVSRAVGLKLRQSAISIPLYLAFHLAALLSLVHQAWLANSNWAKRRCRNEPKFEVLGEIIRMSEILDHKRSHYPLDLQEVGLLPCKRAKWSSGLRDERL